MTVISIYTVKNVVKSHINTLRAVINFRITSSQIGNSFFSDDKFSLTQRIHTYFILLVYSSALYYRAGEVIHTHINMCTPAGDDSLPLC